MQHVQPLVTNPRNHRDDVRLHREPHDPRQERNSHHSRPDGQRWRPICKAIPEQRLRDEAIAESQGECADYDDAHSSRRQNEGPPSFLQMKLSNRPVEDEPEKGHAVVDGSHGAHTRLRFWLGRKRAITWKELFRGLVSMQHRHFVVCVRGRGRRGYPYLFLVQRRPNLVRKQMVVAHQAGDDEQRYAKVDECERIFSTFIPGVHSVGFDQSGRTCAVDWYVDTADECREGIHHFALG